MTATIVPGPRTWSMVRDDQGHREYKLKYLVKCDKRDGPYTAIQASGLPQPGDRWNIDNDTDIWAWCRAGATVTPVLTNEPNKHFEIEYTFGTKPPDFGTNRDGTHSAGCESLDVKDPLLQPMRVSGGFSTHKEEGTTDRFGRLITNSAWEPVRGPQNEWDVSYATIEIEQNVANLDLFTCSSMIDTVNAFPIWNMPSRSVKLSRFTWERKYWGQCGVYYTRRFGFDLKWSTWDRVLLDEGTKVLYGRWASDGSWELKNINGSPPNRFNPAHFMGFIDKKSNAIKGVLDGAGKPWFPEPVPETKWWCINDGQVPRCFNGTCTDAWLEANISSFGAGLYGPYDSQNECKNACSLTMDAAAVWDCNSASSAVGAIFIQKYRMSDFYILGIPVTF